MPDELEREIEEILSKIDKFPKESTFGRLRRRWVKRFRRWRGQVVDLSGPSLADKVRGWLSGRRRGGRW